MADLVRGVAVEVVGEDNLVEAEPKMGAEDFSYFLLERPGTFYFVGSNNEERGLIWGHHHPRFDIDEAVLGVGVESLAKVALRYLES
jgi:amidohydrolase